MRGHAAGVAEDGEGKAARSNGQRISPHPGTPGPEMWHLSCPECGQMAGPFATRREAREEKRKIDRMCVCPPLRVGRCNQQGCHALPDGGCATNAGTRGGDR